MTPPVWCSFGGSPDSAGVWVDPPPASGVTRVRCACGTVAHVAAGRFLPHLEGVRADGVTPRSLGDLIADYVQAGGTL